MRILLVEDHDDTRRAMAALLGVSGHVVVSAATAGEALQSAGPFDCVIIDIGLPDLSGVELMRRLCAAGPVAGIALTGSTQPEDVKACLDAGFAMHLSKPIAIEDLEAALAKIAKG